MSKEILNSPTNDAVGELEQQVSISVCEENVKNIANYCHCHKAYIGKHIQEYFP